MVATTVSTAVPGPVASPPPGPTGASDTSAASRVVAPHPGLALAGRYELRTLIARGGMAEVWEGVDHVLERPVAIKVLHSHLSADESFTARFRAEAIAAARLHHPSIVAIYDTCHDQGHEAIVMELVRGRTLRAVLDEYGRIDPIDAVRIGAQIADALTVAHRAGVIHRDIKPANILLCDERVMVTDFGIAKVHDGSDLTSTGTMLGTVKYLSPEQVAGRPVDPRSDLYSLAVVLYESLTGRPPFGGDTAAAVALARLHQPVVPARALRPDLPEDLDRVLQRALARDPDDRFPDAPAFRAALLAVDSMTRPAPDATALISVPRADPDITTISGSPPSSLSGTPAAPATTPPAPRADAQPTSRPSGRRWVLALVLLTVVATSVGTAAILLARTPTGEIFSRPPTPSGGPQSGAIRVVSVRPFDPAGDGRENDAQVSLAVDGDRSTSWRTETYQTRTFGNLKDGVGLIVTLQEPTPLERLTVRSPTSGWAASVHVATALPGDLSGWGQPVADAEDIRGDVTFELGGATGSFVLLWITDLGDGPGRVEISELTLTAR